MFERRARRTVLHDELAHIGAGLRFSQSPTKFLAELRQEYGDTFLVDVFGYQKLSKRPPVTVAQINGTIAHALDRALH